MNTEALFIFLILLLGLILCSFLGGSFKYYDFTEGFKDNGDTNTFYGPDGATAAFTKGSDGKKSIQLNQTSGSRNVIFTQSSTDKNVYTNPFGFTANVIKNSDGTKAISFSTSSGQTTVFTQTQNQNSSSDNNNDTSSSGDNSQPQDNSSFINALKNKVNTNYNHYTDSTNPQMTSSQYYGSTGYPLQQSGYSLSYQGPYGGSAGSVTGPAGNSAFYAQGPSGNAVAGTSTNSYDYSSTLPPGIPRSQILPGQEDLYILKSEIVPPVCPACPASLSLPRQEPPPPCPACARCPEQSFECKKVPNYNAINNDYLPSPVLNDFSQFGM
jgi:hypothetical protein